MSESRIYQLQRIIEDNPKYRFWFWQIGFWSFIFVISFCILILWYSEATSKTLGHLAMQAVFGLICSLFLYYIFNILTKYSLATRISLSLLIVLASALVWTMLHMQFFYLITGFDDVWDDFGGYYFSGIFVFLCWTGLFHGIRYYELLQSEHRIMLKAEANSREEHIKRIHAQSEARDAKLKMLRYQLNPHFLCNTLNAINSLIEIEESKKAQEMTVQLSEFLRYSLDNDPDTKIQLADEIEALNLYLEIEKTRFSERLSIIIEISEDAQKALVPSLLLQPIIESSMKHAIAKSEVGGTISIEAKVIGQFLQLTLSDTGNGSQHVEEQTQKTGHSQSSKKSNRGVGLKNTNQRLRALYENNYRMDTSVENSGGLRTCISIPLEYE